MAVIIKVGIVWVVGIESGSTFEIIPHTVAVGVRGLRGIERKGILSIRRTIIVGIVITGVAVTIAVRVVLHRI